jgi:hypothetical protein
MSAGSPWPRCWSGLEPVPAPGIIGRNRLLRIEHQEWFGLGDEVHAGASGEIIRVLGAAVEHHHQRQWLAVISARQVKLPGPLARRPGVDSGRPMSSSGSHYLGRELRSRRSAPRQLAHELRHPQPRYRSAVARSGSQAQAASEECHGLTQPSLTRQPRCFQEFAFNTCTSLFPKSPGSPAPCLSALPAAASAVLLDSAGFKA